MLLLLLLLLLLLRRQASLDGLWHHPVQAPCGYLDKTRRFTGRPPTTQNLASTCLPN